MDEHNINKNKGKDADENDLFKNADIPFSKSKSEVWDLLSEKIDNHTTEDKPKGKVIKFNPSKLAVAASIALLIGVGSFMKFYSVSISTQRGEIITALLPDGSQVDLNENTNLKYNPYWWFVSRNLDFEGEAFFKVEKGSSFKVVSGVGTTEVLGTSFNIKSTNGEYVVMCATGKVRVTTEKSSKDTDAILTPGLMAKLNTKNGSLEISKTQSDPALVLWKTKTFEFNAIPVPKVFREIEMNYHVRVYLELENPEKFKYTGSFSKPETAEEAIRLVCKTFGLRYIIEESNDKFRITK